MYDKVPVPTDNIYKFYALFSIVLLTFGMWMYAKTHVEINSWIFKNYSEIEELKAVNERTKGQQGKLDALERELYVLDQDRGIINLFVLISVVVSTFGLGYEFKKWYKEIQPIADATAKAQLELLQLQVEKLRLENNVLAESIKRDNPPKEDVASAKDVENLI